MAAWFCMDAQTPFNVNEAPPIARAWAPEAIGSPVADAVNTNTEKVKRQNNFLMGREISKNESAKVQSSVEINSGVTRKIVKM